MADTVKTPFGRAPKKAVIAGVIGVAGLVVVVWYRHRQSAAAANAATPASTSTASTGYGTGYSSDPYPPDGTTGNPSDPYSTDPATGQTYGDEQSGYGSTPDYGSYGSPLYTGGNTYGTAGTSFTSNAQWAQYAEQYLTAQEGLDPNTVGNAIGKYITGQPVTADQQTVIEQAIAFAGYPPVNGGTGYPPSIDLVAGSTTGTGSGSGGGGDGGSGGGGGGGGGDNDGGGGGGGGGGGVVNPGGPPIRTGGKATVPAVTGMTVKAAHRALAGAGLSFNTDTAKDKPGYDRIVTAQNPTAGTRAAQGSHVGLTWHYVKK